MGHGEAEQGCAQEETCRPGHHDPQPPGKHARRLAGPVEPTPGRPDDATAPRQRAPEPSVEAEPARTAACRSDLPGWAGAHRHGPVRPRHRATRREHPPRRWC